MEMEMERKREIDGDGGKEREREEYYEVRRKNGLMNKIGKERG